MTAYITLNFGCLQAKISQIRNFSQPIVLLMLTTSKVLQFKQSPSVGKSGDMHENSIESFNSVLS